MVAETAHELPHCFGYVDGSEIPLAEKPTQDPEAFFSRKQRYALKMQVVCDHHLRIRHLITGYPGSVHDARIFNNSELALKPESYFSDDEWIAGDSAYKLTSTILTPFRKNSAAANSTDCKRFNRVFSEFRVRIEHCFSCLKERFNSLKELKLIINGNESIKKASIWIMVCAILHNVLLEDELTEGIALQNSPSDDDEEDEPNTLPNSQGEMKRQAIMRLMNL